MFRAIDPYFTEAVQEAFAKIYRKSATRALEILAHRLGMVSHKISKDVVMVGIPKPIRIVLPVKLPDATQYTLPFIKNELEAFVKHWTLVFTQEMPMHQAIYQKAVDTYVKTMKGDQAKMEYQQYVEYVKIMRRGFDARSMGHMSVYCNKFEADKIMPLLNSADRATFKSSKSIYKYHSLVIMGRFLGNVLGRKRIALHSDLIQHSNIDQIVNEAEKKTICFTNYVDTVLEAKRYFESKGYAPACVYSDTNSGVAGILNEFRTSDTMNPLIATIQSLSTGVTLTCANVCIFLNLPWRSGDYEQASNRIFRIGQTAQVYLYDIVLDTGDIPNLSTRMSEIMNWSKDQSDLIMGGAVDVDYSIESLLDYALINNQLISEACEHSYEPYLHNPKLELPSPPNATASRATDW